MLPHGFKSPSFQVVGKTGPTIHGDFRGRTGKRGLAGCSRRSNSPDRRDASAYEILRSFCVRMEGLGNFRDFWALGKGWMGAGNRSGGVWNRLYGL